MTTNSGEMLHIEGVVTVTTTSDTAASPIGALPVITSLTVAEIVDLSTTDMTNDRLVAFKDNLELAFVIEPSTSNSLLVR